MKKIIFIFVFFLISRSLLAAVVDLDEPKIITAKKIEYDVKSDTIKTSGKTEITNASGQRMTLKDSYLSKKGAGLSGDDIKLWLGEHVYIESDNIVRRDDLTIAKKATFTACNDCDSFGDAWKISSSTAVYNRKKRALKFYNPVLWIYKVPVFWIPFFEMPSPEVKHKTGILMPSIQSTNNMGTQINLPLYISFSKSHDLTLKLSYLTRENPLVQVEHRLDAKHSAYMTNASFTRNRESENRWHIFNNDVIELGEYARASLSLERASDKTYLQKYGFYDAQPYLDSGGTLEVFGQSGYVVTDVHIFQELRSTAGYYSAPRGNILPNVRGVYQTKPLFKETYAIVNGDILGISGSGDSSQRVVGGIQIISPWTLWFGNRLIANLSARYDLYNFNNTKMLDGKEFSGLKNRFLPSGYLEWELPLFKSSENWINILEPRARITFMQHTGKDQFALDNDSAGVFLSDSTLFSKNRFAGLDIWENGSYADYGMRWATFNSKGKRFELFLGQSYDFEKHKIRNLNSGFHDGFSDYVGRIEYNDSKWIDILSRFRISEENFSLRHIETSATIGTSRNYLNIGHIWSQQFVDAYTSGGDINEIAGGLGIQLTNRWSLRFNAIYNLTDRHFQRHTGGIFYDHPCYYLSFEYRRDNAIKEDYVGNTTFQFRFGMSIDGKRY